MTCHEFHTAIDAYLDDELSVMAILRMHAHALSCEPCHRMLGSEARLHGLLSDATTHDEPPAALRERIVKRVRAEETSAARRPSELFSFGGLGSWLTGAAMIGVIVVALLIPGGQRQGEMIPLAVEVAAKHLLYSVDSPSALERPGTETSELAQWLGSRVGFTVRVPRLGAGERLLGGRLSSVADAPAAYLLYERHGRRISLFVTRSLPAESPSGFERVIEGVELYASALGHIRLMWWEDEEDGRLYAAAASGADNDLMEFALLCIHSARHREAPRSRHDSPRPEADCATSSSSNTKGNDRCATHLAT
jgi:mycothiol system anti-sigma-R factor